MDGEGDMRNGAWRGGVRRAYGAGRRRRWSEREAATAMGGMAGV